MNKLTYIFISAVAVLSIAACQKTVGPKDDFDAKFTDASGLPTVTLTEAKALSYSDMSASATLSSTEGIIDAGFQISNSEDFSGARITSCIEEDEEGNIVIPSTIETSITRVKDNQTFYVRAYAITEKGTTATSEASKVDIPKAPDFKDTFLFGTYVMTDYTLAGEIDDQYYVEVGQYNGFWNLITISNIWGGGKTIIAEVDFEKKTITTDPYSVIYVHSSYGNCWPWGLYINGSSLAKNPTCVVNATYTEGTITLGYWSAMVSAGSFGNYYSVLTKAE